MKPSEAATIIGCSVGQVRTLIRSRKIRARKVPTENNQWGYTWEITRREAERYRDQDGDGRGWPRGEPRK